MNAQPNPTTLQRASRPLPRLSILRGEAEASVRRRFKVVVLDLALASDVKKWEAIHNNPRITILKDQEHSVKTHILTYVRYMEEIQEPQSLVDQLWPS